ncbi:MAG: 5-formyltetrahydrofolate cyclo-ligase [Acholeplasmataceae bacterium]
MTKKEIRTKMILLRKNQQTKDRRIKNSSIIEQIKKHEKFMNAKTVSIFYPMADEINLLELLKTDKTFLFPKVIKTDMEFYVYHKNMKWTKSSFGVMEPHDEEQMYRDSIDLMIVPALAISKDRSRVGYGKGFYDRYIKNHDIKYTLGVIYDFQEVEHIETTPLDQRLDAYIKGSL